MLGHYLHQVLKETSDSRQHWFARFWSARSATATTCLAGVGFAGFVLVTQDDLSWTVYIWMLLWTSLLVSSLVLLGNRRQAWIASSGFPLLLAVMVMHQMVPSYSRSRTLFGEDSPLHARLSTHRQPAIATIEREFSEVPFYLQRMNIPNFPDIEDNGIGNFVRSHPESVLVVERSTTAKAIRQQIPNGSELIRIGRRGPAMVYQVRAVPLALQIAARKKVVR